MTKQTMKRYVSFVVCQLDCSKVSILNNLRIQNALISGSPEIEQFTFIVALTQLQSVSHLWLLYF